MNLPLSQIALLIGASGVFEGNSVAQGYSIDSRTVRARELFFAVAGDRFNGHDFVEQALAQGAAAAVVQQSQAGRFPGTTPLLIVDDTLLALQRLAAGVRRMWAKRLVGVTGSAGKTTTKEAIAQVLSAKLRVHKSEGNLNNHFGLPLMLLKLDPEHDIGVVEMGMSHAGEIAALAKIARPDIGVITNIAPVHLEFFNSVADIAQAKWELIEALPSNGTAVLNGDDDYLSQLAETRPFQGKVITYGSTAGAQVRLQNLESQGTQGSLFEIVVDGQREQVHLPLLGGHNTYNALAAAAVALECGLTLREAAQSLSNLTPQENRGEVIQLGNITVINDCYNSNPKALQAMVDALSNMAAKRRIVVAGEMLELGPSGEELHRESGRHVADKKIDLLLGVRGLAKSMAEAAVSAGIRAEFVGDADAAGEWLSREVRDGDVVLLKASRGVRLERALEILQARLSSPLAQNN